MRWQAGTYSEAMDFLFGRINYERLQIGTFSSADLKLQCMQELLLRLDSPHEQTPAIHVAGTNGKGSTAAMLASIFSSAGFTTGLFTSPHIRRFEERLQVNGAEPDAAQMIDLINRVAAVALEMEANDPRNSPTFFEIATAMGWLHFRDCGVTIGVVEVGLGGRLDSTNVCHPQASVITNISLDHTQLLGESLEEITREKAGIIKTGVPVVCGIQQPELQDIVADRCRRQEADLYLLNKEITYEFQNLGDTTTGLYGTVDVQSPWGSHAELPLTLAGQHQAQNAALAIATADLIRSQRPFPHTAIRSGMSAVGWPMRIEVVRRNPTVILDSAHNSDSIRSLIDTLDSCFPSRRRILIFATSRDKCIEDMLPQLFRAFDTVILTEHGLKPRSIPLAELEQIGRQYGTAHVETAARPQQAWAAVERLAEPSDLICITGSFFLAAEMGGLLAQQRSSLSTSASQSTTG
ncbi:MAG: folylpolyglutamate synthase/dihydrofolate synthase family protein [Planctomycetaceae bacterium]